MQDNAEGLETVLANIICEIPSQPGAHSPEIPEDSIEPAGCYDPTLLSPGLSDPGELALPQGQAALHSPSSIAGGCEDTEMHLAGQRQTAALANSYCKQCNCTWVSRASRNAIWALVNAKLVGLLPGTPMLPVH